jgi:hypothetical protein
VRPGCRTLLVALSDGGQRRAQAVSRTHPKPCLTRRFRRPRTACSSVFGTLRT